MRVCRYNYSSQFSDFPRLFAELQDMVLQGRYILSDEVESFETAFAKYLDVGFVRGVNCGTDALLLALRSLGVGAGDEVITQANTFHATVAAIRLAGATPVLVDADEDTFLIDTAHLEAAITPKTRAVIPVHLYGKPTPVGPILVAAQKRGIAIIEDAAQAHGARLNRRRVGTIGTLGCFSFHPSKNLAAAGDGGAIATNDPKLADRIECLRSLGQQGQNNHCMLGYNSRLDSLQARILEDKLPRLDSWNEARRHIASSYRDSLTGLPISFQSTTPIEEHVYHLFVIRSSSRDDLLSHLQHHEIDAVVRYPQPIHLQPAFADCKWREGQFPVAEKLAKQLLCLPIRPDMPPEEVNYVADCIRSFFCSKHRSLAKKV